jgi:C-terminal processing protease CtpA/Prc
MPTFSYIVSFLHASISVTHLSKMPKEILNMNMERPNQSTPWGFVIIGGKDQALTTKVGRVKPYSPAEKCGLKPWDYIWQINGKEVFEMTHLECVAEVKNASTMLTLNVERSD